MIINKKIKLTIYGTVVLAFIALVTSYFLLKYEAENYMNYDANTILLIPVIGMLAFYQTFIIFVWFRGKQLAAKITITTVLIIILLLGYSNPGRSFKNPFLRCGADLHRYGNSCLTDEQIQNMHGIDSTCSSLGEGAVCEESISMYSPFQNLMALGCNLSLLFNFVISLVAVWLPKRQKS